MCMTALVATCAGSFVATDTRWFLNTSRGEHVRDMGRKLLRGRDYWFTGTGEGGGGNMLLSVQPLMVECVADAIGTVIASRRAAYPDYLFLGICVATVRGAIVQFNDKGQRTLAFAASDRYP